MRSVGMAFAIAALLCGCAIDDEIEGDQVDDLGDDEPQELAARTIFAGVNGTVCVESPYNCRFRPGPSRVMTASGLESWGVAPGASIRDGNGDVMGVQREARMIFNYGQTRALAGKAHALALATSNLSAGWYPIDHILGEQSFRGRMGEVNAQDPGRGPMGCYAIRDGHDASIELLKVVYDSQVGDDGHERAGDYQALVRANGVRSANLIFSVPGFSLGGATTDHFPAGTRFRRVDVPTRSGRPSITIPLWAKDGDGRFVVRRGEMTFLYGYVRAADGTRRFGWMAREALDVSSGCR